MAILDWIKELQLTMVLKERLVESEKQIAALQTENVELKTRLEQCQEYRRALEEQVSEERRKAIEEERNFAHGLEPPNLGF